MYQEKILQNKLLLLKRRVITLTGELVSVANEVITSNTALNALGKVLNVSEGVTTNQLNITPSGQFVTVNNGVLTAPVELIGKQLGIQLRTLTTEGADIPIIIPPPSSSGGFVTSRHTRTTIPTSHLVDVEKDDMEIIEIICLFIGKL